MWHRHPRAAHDINRTHCPKFSHCFTIRDKSVVQSRMQSSIWRRQMWRFLSRQAYPTWLLRSVHRLVDSPHCTDPSKSVDHPRDPSAGAARRAASSFKPQGMRLTPACGSRESHDVRPHKCGCPVTTWPLYRSYPTPSDCGIHTLNQNESEHGEICTSIFVQSKNINNVESRPEGIPWWVPEY
jgi:hypothetical protein